jgi:predicted nucleic acid-binding protein
VTLYLDTSSLLKRYVEEPESAQCERYLLADPIWVTARHTAVEVRRNLARLLTEPALSTAVEDFGADWRRMHIIELDEATCEHAIDIAIATGARTLDALHLAALVRLGLGGTSLLTYDVRQAQAARSLGANVIGV